MQAASRAAIDRREAVLGKFLGRTAVVAAAVLAGAPTTWLLHDAAAQEVHPRLFVSESGVYEIREAIEVQGSHHREAFLADFIAEEGRAAVAFRRLLQAPFL